MPMASNVGDTTQGGRLALTWQRDRWEVTAGVDGRQSEHRRRSAAGRGAYRAQPWSEDARFRTLGVFAESHWHIDDVHHLMSGVRVDRARVDDLRTTTGSGMMPMPNPTAGQRRSGAFGFLVGKASRLRAGRAKNGDAVPLAPRGLE